MVRSRDHGRAMMQHLNQGSPWPKRSRGTIDGINGPAALKDGVHLSTVQATSPGELHFACLLSVFFSQRGHLARCLTS